MQRGEMWLVNLEPGFGREIHKRRPALIISANAIHQKLKQVIIIPASSQVPKTIGIEMVRIGAGEGAHKTSVLLPIFLRSIDTSRLVKKIGSLSEEKLREVEGAITLVLDLAPEGENI